MHAARARAYPDSTLYGGSSCLRGARCRSRDCAIYAQLLALNQRMWRQ